MKAVVAVIIAVVIIAVGGFFGVPVLIKNETALIRSDIEDLKNRITGIEEFIKSEEEARKTTQLAPGADTNKIIKTVNAIAVKVSAIEESYTKGLTATNEAMIRDKAAAEESLKKQAETIDKIAKEAKANVQKIEFSSILANLRSHLLRVHIELRAKNIATARNEMDLLHDMLEKAKSSASEGDKKIIKDLQDTLKKARTEAETDLPATINLVNLVWHDIGKLLQKE